MDALILDIGVLFVFFIFVFIGFKNGILKSFLSLVGALFSVFLSVYFSDILSKEIYFRFVSPQIENRVRELLNASALNLENFFGKVPFSIFNFLPKFGITTEEFNHIINNSTAEVLPSKMSELMFPVVTSVLKSVLVCILFVLFIIAMRFVSAFILRLFKAQFFKKANSVIGGVFGAFKGYIVIVVIMCWLKVFISTNSEIPEVFSQNNISSTTIFKVIYDNNPVYGLFKTI